MARGMTKNAYYTKIDHPIKSAYPDRLSLSRLFSLGPDIPNSPDGLHGPMAWYEPWPKAHGVSLMKNEASVRNPMYMRLSQDKR